jgi:hypothetical protein
VFCPIVDTHLLVAAVGLVTAVCTVLGVIVLLPKVITPLAIFASVIP